MAAFGAPAPGWRLRWAVVAGVAVGGAVTALLVGTGTLRHGGPADPASTERREAARTFAEAWERSLRGTWRVTTRWERRVDGEVVLAFDGETVQRPPDRLDRRGGQVVARIGGRLVACAAGPDGVIRCREGGAAPDWDADVAEQVRRLRALVGGALPVYGVERDGASCWRLTLQVRVAEPAFGERARFCFDERTGAMVRALTDSGAAVDEEVALAVTGDVTGAAFALPAPVTR